MVGELAGLVAALMPAVLKVLDGVIAGRAKGVTPEAARRAEVLRDFLAVVGPGVDELVAVLKADRAWMKDVAARTGESLPEGFEARGFDREGVGAAYRRLLAELEALA